MSRVVTTDAAAHGRMSDAQRAMLALGAILLLRLVALMLNRTDLFFDESQYWSWSREPAFGYYSKPPLIAWLIRGTTALCGHGEACVRLAAPLLHTATAAVLFLVGRRLYGSPAGLWTAVTYALLPGVSLSSALISTDAPLLLCWAVALHAFVQLIDDADRDRRSWRPALVLGLAIGLGLNAKYAMAYFVLCALLYLALTPVRRRVLSDARLWAAIGLGLVCIVPNLAWNAAHSFATFEHTADNANWRSGSLANPLRALEFVGSQFGVFGPLLFAALLAVAVRGARGRLADADRLLLMFALPILAVVTLQAFLSRAHANWAAPAYVSATVLVVGTLVRDGHRLWLRSTLALHAAVALVIAAGLGLAGTVSLPGGDPLQRLLGWRAIADAARGPLAEARRAAAPYAALVSGDRAITASLLYYLRDDPTPVIAWRPFARPRDHFELTRPMPAALSGPVLLVTLFKDDPGITDRFTSVRLVGAVEARAGKRARTVYLYALSGHKGR